MPGAMNFISMRPIHAQLKIIATGMRNTMNVKKKAGTTPAKLLTSNH